MKPVYSLLFLLGFAVLASCSEDGDVQSSSDEDGMFTNGYQIAPQFLTEEESAIPYEDLVAKGYYKTAEEKLTDAGIPFPDGAAVIASGHVFWVRNTETNLRKMEKYFDREYGPENWKPHVSEAVLPIDPNDSTANSQP